VLQLSRRIAETYPMQQLIDHIEQYVMLNSEAREALEQYANIESYQKNQHILVPGHHCNKIWFLNKGMVRKYHISDGKEITAWIHNENDTFTSLQSYARRIESEEFLQACEETEVVAISRNNSAKLAEFPEFLTYSSAMMERDLVNIDVHSKAMNQRDAKGKYEYLKEIAPAMVQRAKLGHIASIIGVTPETLSRIRRL
jgi:CRP-like cAMP-binding protein